ncbi:hypothetical protein KUTeg_021984 [Tegillarca granosa]|uniref:Uncharacterized protein n=1 Tax=Tegillarca granosa TaxID=220873 RepID=A0ABQ9EAG7_TEGGR|nr:hypothetical protein KUTeg_021984 [Tegillarca granosa]
MMIAALEFFLQMSLNDSEIISQNNWEWTLIPIQFKPMVRITKIEASVTQTEILKLSTIIFQPAAEQQNIIMHQAWNPIIPNTCAMN